MIDKQRTGGPTWAVFAGIVSPRSIAYVILNNAYFVVDKVSGGDDEKVLESLSYSDRGGSEMSGFCSGVLWSYGITLPFLSTPIQLSRPVPLV